MGFFFDQKSTFNLTVLTIPLLSLLALLNQSAINLCVNENSHFILSFKLSYKLHLCHKHRILSHLHCPISVFSERGIYNHWLFVEIQFRILWYRIPSKRAEQDQCYVLLNSIRHNEMEPDYKMWMPTLRMHRWTHYSSRGRRARAN